MATTALYSDMSSHPVLCSVGPSFVFQQDNDPKHTSRLCNGYLTKKESDGMMRQMTWPPQPLNLNPVGWWFGMNFGQQVLSTTGNSLKTVGKPFQVTTL